MKYKCADKIINHTVFVLIVNQSIGEITFIRRLLPQALSDYLGTSTMLSDSKETSIQLSECGLIILDEIEVKLLPEITAQWKITLSCLMNRKKTISISGLKRMPQVAQPMMMFHFKFNKGWVRVREG